tara:strand:+ start:8980 stop:10821 length:1842 start_codon:yes stop_codon:yes gene_type:complete
MCGIAGYLGKTKLDRNIIFNNLKLMRSRGPNHQSFCQHEIRHKSLTLFASRLSIIDLNHRSNQPIKDDNFTLIYNGEIYNYLEIRDELIKKGIKFKTNSDTEVVIKSYKVWGSRCIEKFEGMWAFAIYDEIKKLLFISRDRFGEKPLYYYFKNNSFIFGSEIKYILNLDSKKNSSKLNYNKLKNYLVNGYKVVNKNNETFFKDIKKLDSGTNLYFDLRNMTIKFEKYLKKNDLVSIKKHSIKENIDNVKILLENSLKLRLRSDVPVAFCLSGGIDSSALVSIAKKKFNHKVKCFSIIDDDPNYNEERNIDLIQRDTGCEVEKIYLKNKRNFFGRLENLVINHDSPISTLAYYVHSFISESASNQNYKVILSGTGADEILTGYYDHFLLHLYETKNTKEFKKSLFFWTRYIKPFIRNPILRNSKLYTKNRNFREHVTFNNKIFNRFLKNPLRLKFSEKKYNNSLLKNRMINELFHESVPINLHEDDLNSMNFSIENRSPFLDTKLVKYCLSIKNKNYIQNGYGKFILREAMKKYIHKDVRLDRRKRGFNANLKTMVNFKNFNLYEYLSENKDVKELVNIKRIQNLDLNKNYTNSLNKFIFSLINIKIFLKHFSL